MSQACNLPRARVGLRRPAATGATVLTSIVLLTLPARAEPIEFDHESAAVAPIEIVEQSTPEARFEADGEPAANEPVPADTFAASSEVAGPDVETAAKPVPQMREKVTSEPHSETDIYDQWARKKYQRRQKEKPHPLAATLPDHFVVVCQANCAKEQEHVVYLERRDARGPVNKKPIKAGVVAGTTSIDCVGGCYSEQKTYASVSGVQGAPVENGWVSNGKKDTPSKKETSSGGRWYDRIN